MFKLDNSGGMFKRRENPLTNCIHHQPLSLLRKNAVQQKKSGDLNPRITKNAIIWHIGVRGFFRLEFNWLKLKWCFCGFFLPYVLVRQTYKRTVNLSNPPDMKLNFYLSKSLSNISILMLCSNSRNPFWIKFNMNLKTILQTWINYQ